jgi:hypothetical protein
MPTKKEAAYYLAEVVASQIEEEDYAAAIFDTRRLLGELIELKDDADELAQERAAERDLEDGADYPSDLRRQMAEARRLK